MSSANTFGNRFIVTTFGESHGPSLGVLIDGCPSGVNFNLDLLKYNLKRRRPGQSEVTTARQEADEPEILSGIYLNKTLGTPICAIIRNGDARSQDYDNIKNKPRSGHADEVWKTKFVHVDHRGGGRSSGRETVSRVIAGSVAQMFFQQLYPSVGVFCYTSQVGSFALTEQEHSEVTYEKIENSKLRLPSIKSDEIEKFVLEQKNTANSVGGSATIKIKNIPKSLGQPVFHKLKNDFASAYMSIGATSGFSIGFQNENTKSGVEFHSDPKNYGGLLGGISTGEELVMTVQFKPTSSIGEVAKAGRHDPFIIPRAIPVLEAMTWLVLADHELWRRGDCV